ncbi:MAG: Crp/Fnr family transcriptional regulator [Bacteroidota bacterium]
MINHFIERLVKGKFLSEELKNSLEHHLSEISLKKGEVLIPYGSMDTSAYLIKSGVCVCRQISESGNTRVVWFYFPEVFEVFGAPDSFVLNQHTKYEVEAIEDSTVIKLPGKDRIELLAEKHPEINAIILSNLMVDFVTVFEARSNLLTFTPTEYLEFLHREYPAIFTTIPAKYIADFMGVTPEWYSKLKKAAIPAL